MKMAHAFVLGEPAGLEGKAISFWPARLILEVQQRQPIVVGDLEASPALHLLAWIVKAQRFPKRVTKPDVCQPSLLELDEQRHVVEIRAKDARIIQHACRQPRHLKAELSEEGAEQPIDLVAESAPMTADDLVEERVFVEDDRPAGVDIQILERDRLYVRSVQGPQCRPGRRARARVANAAQVRVDIHCKRRIHNLCGGHLSGDVRLTITPEMVGKKPS